MAVASKNSSKNSSRTASRPVTPPNAESSGAEPDEVGEVSPAGLWHQTFGEALSPGVKKRNIRLHERTPSKTHLGDESSAWLARHQESVRNKLEKKCARAIKRGVSPSKPHHPVPLVPLATGSWGGASRQPPLVPVDTPPQMLLFEMEGLLVERFRRSIWSGAAQSHGRPGVVSGLLQLRRTFLLCVICRSDAEVAQRVLAELNSRGLRFDLAYALPPSYSRRKSSPCLTLAAQEQLRADTATASLEALQRRTLLVASLELERAELESRMLEPPRGSLESVPPSAEPASASTEPPGVRVSSPTPARLRSPRAQRSRPRLHQHVRLLMQDVATVLVPHPRLQANEQAVIMSEIAIWIELMYAACKTDWVAAQLALPEAEELWKLSTCSKAGAPEKALEKLAPHKHALPARSPSAAYPPSPSPSTPTTPRAWGQRSPHGASSLPPSPSAQLWPVVVICQVRVRVRVRVRVGV